MSEFVFVQLPLEPEGPPADVTVQLVGVLAVLGPLVLHPPPVGGKDCPALPPAGVGLDPRVAVEVALHVTMHEEPLTTDRAGVAHVSSVLSEVLFQMLFLSIFPFTARKVAFVPKI